MQNKKYCGPNCKGPFDKSSSGNKVPCKCEADSTKCSCIKPWLNKAAQRMKERRASSTSPATTSRIPLPTSRPNSARCPSSCGAPENGNVQFMEELEEFQTPCTTPGCKRTEGGRTVCTGLAECKKKHKKGTCATTCKLGRRPCPKKSKRPICGQPMASRTNPCTVCAPYPCVTCPGTEPPPPFPPPYVDTSGTPRPSPYPKPPKCQPKPPPEKPQPPPEKPKPVEPKPEKVSIEPPPPVEPEPEPEPVEVEPPPKPEPVPCEPCPLGSPCPPCPPCPKCAPEIPEIGPCTAPCGVTVSGDSAVRPLCKKEPPCPEKQVCPQGDAEAYFVGVDVGTGSARAALVKENGEIINTHAHDIKTWNMQADFYEQSSDDIWEAVCICVKEVISIVSPDLIKGIGFDATCSLVSVDENGQPLSVSPSGNDEQNIILWLDHRAVKEADEINSTNHTVLTFVGGKISPEQENPKLMWLKKNLKESCWDKAGYFFDLPDFLTWRATDSDSRSVCSLVCKWNYEMKMDGSRVEGTNGWNKSFFEQINLIDLSKNNWKKIGSQILVPGCPVGSGLSERAAKELQLNTGTPVGTSIIDAHAGGLGLIGCKNPQADPEFHTRICLICGTSTCHMAVSDGPILTPGIWGPYRHAMIPGMWLNEGGQSATGKLIDHVIECHPATEDVMKELGDTHIQEYLNVLLNKMSETGKDLAFLTNDLHVWPDFHGNRSPIADPTLKGMICGLTLDKNVESLALLYLATIQALAYGARHIIERLASCGYTDIKTLLVCGGLSKNQVFVKTLADSCNLPVLIPDEPECVLLGAAMLGARASGHFPSMDDTIHCMTGCGQILAPDSEVISYHDRKYKVFLKMYEDQVAYKGIMSCLCKVCSPK